jgi:hypothetical protein
LSAPGIAKRHVDYYDACRLLLRDALVGVKGQRVVVRAYAAEGDTLLGFATNFRCSEDRMALEIGSETRDFRVLADGRLDTGSGRF